MSSAWKWSRDHVDDHHKNHLKLVSGLSFVQIYKQHSYELLDLSADDYLLDIGCGLGDDVAALASQLHPNGRAIGLDSSSIMLQQAGQKHEDRQIPLDFSLGDAASLPFVEDSFDAVRTDRVLQHIPDPQEVLKEIKRVLKSGSRIVCSETDWETLSVDVTDRDIYRKIKSHHVDSLICNGWMGRQINGFLIELGFEDVRPVAHTATFTDYDFTRKWGVWHRAIESAQETGVITAEEAGKHLQDLDNRAKKGQHLLTLTLMLVSARKP